MLLDSLPTHRADSPLLDFSDRQVDFPKYFPGLWATIGWFLIWALLAIMTFTFSRANKAVDEGTRVIEEQEGFRYAL